MLPRKYEIELTSACNAVCPGCKRTLLLDKGAPFNLNTFDIDDIEDIFSDINMFGTKVKFCGVLGDPIACKDLFENERPDIDISYVCYYDESYLQ